MDSVETELAAHDAHLVDERLDGPQRLVCAIRFPAAELVVEDRAAPRLCERLERLEVVVRPAGPAVQQDDRKLPLVLAFPDDAIPRPVTAERDETFGQLDHSEVGTGCEGPDGSFGFARSSASAGVCRADTRARWSVASSTLSGWWQAARCPLP